MKICVFGTGAVGGWIGGAWASAGIDVTLIGRAGVAEEVARHGLTISDGSGDGPAQSIHLPAGTILCTSDAKACADADVILVTVKSNDTKEAARAIARHARKDAALLSFQNGISNPQALREGAPGRPVLTGIVPFNVVRLGNGRWHKTVAGELIAQDHEVTRAIRERVGKRPGSMRLVEDMIPVAWSKLLINLNNAVNALSGKPLLEQLQDRDYRRVVAASIDEALAVMKLAGIAPAKMGLVSPTALPKVMRLPNPLFAPFLKAQKIDPEGRSSMADDFAAGRATEIDFLNGEVVALARRHGRNPRVNAGIVQLVKEAEAGVERRWSGAELKARLLNS
ncbi:MAG TPA: 2-dehydropantoate 2-reductase [Allosphingosinicella sp.]|jgi:2-dehydropantoate 2-reductase